MYSGNWQKCEREYICEDLKKPYRERELYGYKADEEDPFYLVNWVEKLDLICKSDA